MPLKSASELVVYLMLLDLPLEADKTLGYYRQFHHASLCRTQSIQSLQVIMDALRLFAALHPIHSLMLKECA
jgi:hypothetical protein